MDYNGEYTATDDIDKGHVSRLIFTMRPKFCSRDVGREMKNRRRTHENGRGDRRRDAILHLRTVNIR